MKAGSDPRHFRIVMSKEGKEKVIAYTYSLIDAKEWAESEASKQWGNQWTKREQFGKIFFVPTETLLFAQVLNYVAIEDWNE